MNAAFAKNLAVLAALTLGTVAATGCTAENASTDEAEPEAASQALDNGSGGGHGYTCTDSGFCQCQGLADCNDMFLQCKSHVYCNQDAQGLRCSCLNFVLRTVPGTPIGGTFGTLRTN